MPVTRIPPGVASASEGVSPAVSELRTVRVLAVMPSAQDLTALQHIFRRSNWIIDVARSFQEARLALSQNCTPVVITECDLGSHNWKDVLQVAAERTPCPRLIVTCWHADNCLWQEVLTLGGYDLLPKPFDAPEVFRVVSLAWRDWKDAWERSSTSRVLRRVAGR